MNIKKNDTVCVLSGKDKGKKGKVLTAMPSEGKLIVEGVNMCAHHIKPRRQGEEGGIIRRETPIYVSKVQLVCPKCGKQTRVGHKILADGSKSRVCKKCGETI
jgi:large subunit ribosomal protein L24